MEKGAWVQAFEERGFRSDTKQTGNVGRFGSDSNQGPITQTRNIDFESHSGRVSKQLAPITRTGVARGCRSIHNWRHLSLSLLCGDADDDPFNSSRAPHFDSSLTDQKPSLPFFFSLALVPNSSCYRDGEERPLKSAASDWGSEWDLFKVLLSLIGATPKSLQAPSLPHRSRSLRPQGHSLASQRFV